MLTRLVDWGGTCGLRFNPEKTVAVLFTRKAKPKELRITFDGKIMDYADKVRYLGVDLDSRLHWNHHITQKIKQAKKVMMGVSALVSWTLPTHYEVGIPWPCATCTQLRGPDLVP